MLSVCHGFVFTHLSEVFICASGDSVSVREAGRWGVPTTIGQLNVSQHLTCRRGSEFVGLQLRGHQLVLLFSLGVLVLQAAAWPRVGDVLLHTVHFLFSDTGLLLFLKSLTVLHQYLHINYFLPCNDNKV